MEDPVPYGKQQPVFHWVKNQLYYHDYQMCHFWFRNGLLYGKRIMVKLSFPTSEKFNECTDTKSVNALRKTLEKEARLFIEKVKQYEREG